MNQKYFTVKISRDTTDRLSTSLSIPADTQEEAITKAKELWGSGNLMLSYERRVSETDPSFEASLNE